MPTPSSTCPGASGQPSPGDHMNISKPTEAAPDPHAHEPRSPVEKVEEDASLAGVAAAGSLPAAEVARQADGGR